MSSRTISLHLFFITYSIITNRFLHMIVYVRVLVFLELQSRRSIYFTPTFWCKYGLLYDLAFIKLGSSQIRSNVDK